MWFILIQNVTTVQKITSPGSSRDFGSQIKIWLITEPHGSSRNFGSNLVGWAKCPPLPHLLTDPPHFSFGYAYPPPPPTLAVMLPSKAYIIILLLGNVILCFIRPGLNLENLNDATQNFKILWLCLIFLMALREVLNKIFIQRPPPPQELEEGLTIMVLYHVFPENGTLSLMCTYCRIDK